MGKWYAVTVGKRPGVYSSWIEAAAQIRNIPGGPIYQGFPTEAEAIHAFSAALERGEVRAYPDAKSDLDEPCNDAPVSPLGGEAALLRTPVDVKREDVKPTGLQTSVHSRLAQLRQTLRNPTDSSSISSSPPTAITRVNVPLYVDDDVPRSAPVVHSPHYTWASSASRAYPSISGARPPVRIDVSDRDSSLSASPRTEERTPRTPRSMPLRPERPSRRKGVKYLDLSDLENTQSLDPRIWVPQSPTFDIDKVKRWPAASRSPSPTKKVTPLPSEDENGDGSDAPIHVALPDMSFVSAGRGRHSKLTPTMSLPILPKRELEEDESCPTQAWESPRRAGTSKANKMVYSLSDSHLEGRRTECGSPKNYGKSRVQGVPRDGGQGESRIVVHSPCVHLGSVHVLHQSIPPEMDVRSPISKGTLIPMNVGEALFARPSPQFHSCNA